jgi:hypothetical protein
LLKNNFKSLLCYGCKQRVQQLFSGTGFVNLCCFCKELPYAQRESMIEFNKRLKKTEDDDYYVSIYEILEDLQNSYSSFRSLELTDKDCGSLLRYINDLKANQKKDCLAKEDVSNTNSQ